jgi:hypothetical protein
MKHIRLVIGLTAVAALGATAASAAPKHHARNVHHTRTPAIVEHARNPHSSFEPARMIEAKPGVFISSYGCISDDGYGRWTYCGQGRGGD